MTDVNTTPANGDSTTLLPVHRLIQVEDQLNHLLACHVFYDTAIRAITQLEVDEPTANDRWQLDLFLQQQWLHDQGNAVVSEQQIIRQALVG